MKKREPVSHIMTHNVLSINQDAGLKKALDIVKRHKIRHLPVVQGNSIVGIISSTDLNRLTFSNLFENQDVVDEAILEMLSISQVMSSKPRVVSPTTLIKDVAKIFANEHFSSLPVLENDQLVGIVTTTDVIEYLLEQY